MLTMFRRLVKWFCGVTAALALTLALFLGFILDWKGKPFCHAQISMLFRVWVQDRATDSYPNVNGSSVESLKQLQTATGMMDSYQIASQYRYVPGLEDKDPGQFILLYFDQPTRWTYHVSVPTIFEEKGWIILSPGFGFQGQPSHLKVLGQGEMGQRVTTAEFKRRLKETLEFLRANNRPHWQEVAAEHTAFLEEIERKGL